MAASTIPPNPLSIDLVAINNDERPVKNKSRTNYTVAYFYSAVREVVSDPRRKRTRDTQSQHCANDSPPPKTLAIRVAPLNPSQALYSPQSVFHALEHGDRVSMNPSAALSSRTVPSAALPSAHLSSSLQARSTRVSNHSQAFVPPLLKEKIEVNYDMNLVPKVKKNPDFLRKWRHISGAEARVEPGRDVRSFSHTPSTFSLPSLLQCDSPCDASCGGDSAQEPDACSEGMALASNSSDCSNSCTGTEKEESQSNGHCYSCLHPSYSSQQIAPFDPKFESESVIWAPKYTDWDDCIDEMEAVCTAAEWPKHRNRRKNKPDFKPPISRIYIKDRMLTDDPLCGYQIRHKTGGWLQGFVTMTTFTTWTHYFKWDTEHKANGIDRANPNGMLDNGSLAGDLEGQIRSGDPLGEGVVWPTIAEISLLGALGCGEYLLQMALDDIARKDCYDFVVLDATDTSRPFYEKFGFVRVGAVCKYGNEKDIVNASGDVEVVGYRHWTYPSETVQRLDVHGAPSCMMVRRIKRYNPESSCPGCGTKASPSFVDELSKFFVRDKPRIKPSGSSRRKRSLSGASSPTAKSAKTATTAANRVKPSGMTSSGRKSVAPSRLEQVEKLTKSKKSSVSRTSMNSNLPPAPPQDASLVKEKGKNGKPIELRKQKIPTVRSPRKHYFYNKVVTPKQGENTSSYKSKYYFVINYDPEAEELRLIPLYVKGVFKGKREGHLKWKATVLPRKGLDETTYLKSMDVITSSLSKWDIVKPAYAVTKCAGVQEESWDITG